jgi:hypothetical protein
VITGLGLVSVFGFVVGVAVRMAAQGFETAGRGQENNEDEANYFFHFVFFDEAKVGRLRRPHSAKSGVCYGV